MKQLACAWAFSLLAAAATAAQPARFNYQGLATDGDGAPLEGNHPVFFSLYRGGTAGGADSGTLLYRESTNLDLESGEIVVTPGNCVKR